jgi:Cu-Zn family superoxide dismutase
MPQDRLRRIALLGGPLSVALLILAGVASAQDSTPGASPAASPISGEALPVALVDVEGRIVGTGTVAESAGQVLIQISGTGLEPGEHGVHIHEFGVCAAGDEPFASAGAHYNPTGAGHGGPEDEDAHAGDLGNLLVDNDGSYTLSIATDRISLDPAASSTLRDADGSALLIHAAADDLETDPSGNSGGRVACGVIIPSTVAGTPVASPPATPGS